MKPDDTLFAGTLHSLIKKSLDRDPDISRDVFLMCFCLEVTKHDLLALILCLMEDRDDPYFTKATQLLQYWIDLYWIEDFVREDDNLRLLICSWKALSLPLTLPAHERIAVTHSMRQVSREPIQPFPAIHDGGLLQLGPKELAHQLCLLDMESIQTVNRDRLLQYVQSGGKIGLAITIRFNRLTASLVSAVLHEETPKERARVLEFIVQLGEELKRLGNFQSLGCVVAALTTSTVTRLRRTRSEVKKKYQTMSEGLVELMSVTRSFGNMRKAYLATPHPKIPFVAVTMTDLNFVFQGNSRYLSGSSDDEASTRQINYWNWTMYHSIITEFMHPRGAVDYPFVREERVMTMLSDLLVMDKSWNDQTYQRSLELEPRNQ
ncbi:hypothetical protein PROFUN_07337 [Planoprotostelium fungivorum]|uniref:Ras-GEF domain-containing protein n=1 Tax=Planoprotostelium fungivorum TaxID=1890364 RepID=A0A2P6N2H2_9EUKA|nr:hypothetical protein PROFUN_11288 [Planoprotostelium fungivorum]PRP84952.1 hypothetical protein PROFUN_07337 [Planoprotostelium fungivorum]